MEVNMQFYQFEISDNQLVTSIFCDYDDLRMTLLEFVFSLSYTAFYRHRPTHTKSWKIFSQALLSDSWNSKYIVSECVVSTTPDFNYIYTLIAIALCCTFCMHLALIELICLVKKKEEKKNLANTVQITQKMNANRAISKVVMQMESKTEPEVDWYSFLMVCWIKLVNYHDVGCRRLFFQSMEQMKKKNYFENIKRKTNFFWMRQFHLCK